MKYIGSVLWTLFLLAACNSTPPTLSPTTPVPNQASTSLPTSAPTRTAAPPTTSLPEPGAPANSSPTARPSLTPSPAPTATRSASPTVDAPSATLKQLTTGGCCVAPFWSPDSKQVLFIDKPNASAPTGYYAVSVNAPGAPQLWSERIANYTSDLKYAVRVQGEFAIVEQLSDGAKWQIRTGGRLVSLSPDRTRVVWNQACETCFPVSTRVTNVMMANLDGTNVRRLTSLTRAGGTSWIDNQHLLMSARLDRNSEVITAFVYSLADDSRRDLVKSDRLRGLSLSRGGEWLAYTIVYDEDAAQNGLWVMRTDGSVPPRKLSFYGAFQWRDGRRLIYVPLVVNVSSHVFYEYDVSTGVQRQLTDPKSQPFKIANGDWSVSPDGNRIVFVSAQDQNLWLWSFGDDLQ